MLLQQEMEDKVISPEKAEEAKLKARYPNLGAKPGGSDLLRKRLQKGVGFIPKSGSLYLLPIILTFLFFVFSSKSTLTLVTTTWPRQKWRINSCHQPQRRRRRSQADTSQHLRTCLKERLLLWPANWLVDGFYVHCFVIIPTPTAYLPAVYIFIYIYFTFVCILKEQVMYQVKFLIGNLAVIKLWIVVLDTTKQYLKMFLKIIKQSSDCLNMNGC